MTTNVLINIDVDDLERGIRFYTEALALRVGRRLGPDFVELLGAGVPLYLLLKDVGTAVSERTSMRRTYERHWTPVHLDVVVDDLERAIERAERAGAKRESSITTHRWGRMALFSDPFGHGFCLLQFNERGYDALVSQPVGTPTER